MEPTGEPTIRLRSTDLDWRIVEGEVVMLDGQERYMAANQAGATLWPMLAEGATRSALAIRLREQFDIDEQVASRDVDAFLSELRVQGLLEDE
jgi:hypothetical protein